MINARHVLILVVPCALTGCQTGTKDSWPQWGGPQRNFAVSHRPLELDWPERGPRQLWKRELGPGYGTIACDGRRLYTMYRGDADGEVVLALDPQTGSTVWEHSYPCPLIDEGEGEGKKRHDTRFGTPPQATPLIVGDRLYTFGFGGKLICFKASSGRVLWQHDLYDDFGANFMRFGYSSSPVAYKDTIILPVGGKSAQGVHNGISAFDQKTGKVRWRSTDYDTVFSSPIVANLDGEDLLITYMQDQLVALSPKTGESLWQYQAQGKFTDSIMTPIWCPGNRLFCRIGGDESGATAMLLSNNQGTIHAERLWLSNKVKGSLANPVLIGNTFYGPGGRTGIFHAWDLDTGEVLWRERGYPRSSCIAVGDRLLILDEKGRLTLATPDRKGLNVATSAQVREEPSWSGPTLVDSTLFLRDNKHIVALELAPSQAAVAGLQRS